MRFTGIFILLLALSFSVSAKKVTVASATEINNPFWYAGDTIVMKSGTWTNQTISFRADGTLEAPIVLMTESPGETILNGTSSLSFSGKYIIVDGLNFKDGNLSGSAVISFRTSSSSLANNCRVTNTTIENYNPPLNTTDSKWVSLYGKDNRVDHCTFINKTNSGTLLVVWLTSGIIPNHIIDHNYFGYRNSNLDSNGNELNGQEIIRIGDSSTSMQTAGVHVSDNFFEHCNGEIEIISNKSCENIYSNNVFYECSGMLTLRHGNRCTVEGNYFFGNGISNSGGVRIIGEDHKVYNNYFEKLQGTGYRAALCIVRGKENSALNEYFQVKNALVAFNTMVDCKQSFSINYNSSSSLTMPPIGTTIAHNHVYNSSASLNNIAIYQVNIAAMDVTWKNNLMNKGTYSGYTVNPSEVVVGIDPGMAAAGTSIEIFEPQTGSALGDYTTDEYPEITLDLRGREMGSLRIPGASQLSGTPGREMPTRTSTGADYNHPVNTSEKLNVKASDFTAFIANHKIISTVSKPGTLQVFDISGRCLHQQKMEQGPNMTALNSTGIYILRFLSSGGEVQTMKIASN
ncbi:MAG: T9SS type A sorting domain-containing protein [Bacteroidales bacterium]|nr:T9SS type A sorting domain-containing protein [Bacteroidales bacterium]MCB8999304.1 T9SS type A sorting domain-containing protein [Bacteroidales bacterium]MCB9012440.1 T9SS type A sorting domain-containing protein [Bacteroidales bacterium]